MRIPTTALATAVLVGCGPGDPDQAPLPACEIITDQRVTPETLKVSSDGCGEVVLGDFRVVGEGGLVAELFSDGNVLLPTVRAESAGTFRAFHSVGWHELHAEGDPVLLRQGYQSWSASGVFPLDTPLELDADGLPAAGGDDGGFEVIEEVPGGSWWVGVAGHEDGTSAALGVVSARATKFHLSFDGRGIHAVWGGRGEEIALEEGEVLYLDPLWVGLGPDPLALLDRYAAEVVATTPPRPLAEPPPVGWASWYTFYEDVTEEQVRANLEALEGASTRPELAATGLVQIDDGWSRHWGEWTPNGRFPSGMSALAAEISVAGFVPGIWMAPFYVHRDAAIYAEHDDWWVRDRDGGELEYLGHVIVDATHPDAGAWMADQVRARVDEGFAYLKLDFLFAGAQEGVRFEDVSGTAAYHAGMALLREAAGDSWLLACGAPLLPTVGYAESFRTGPDIAFSLTPDPNPAFLRNQVRSTAARGWTNGVWWWADPDQLLVRDPFDDAQVTGSVVAQAVSGGPWLLGDDLTALPDTRLQLALHAAAAELRGMAVRPRQPLRSVSGFDPTPLVELVDPNDQVPAVWDFADGTVALLNLSDTEWSVGGPGGVELLTGATAPAGARTLPPGAGELWRPGP